MKHKNENNPSTFNKICPTFRIGEIEKKCIIKFKLPSRAKILTYHRGITLD